MSPRLLFSFKWACFKGDIAETKSHHDDTDTRGGTGGGFAAPATVQTQKFSWVTGEGQAPVIETKRLEDIHGVRVRTALHTLAAMGPADPRKNKYIQIMAGGRFAPIYTTVREIAKDLRI